MSVFFNGVTNCMDAGIKYTLRKLFDTKMGITLDFFEGTEVLQRDLSRLGGWAVLNCMHFNTCSILYVEWGYPGSTSKLGNKRLEHRPTERLLEFWVNRKLNMSQQPGGSTISWGASGIAGQLREGIVPLYPVLDLPFCEFCVQFGALQ